jgi:hypothetical protein
MQRPKQQALLFLLGAVLVGGILGFASEHMLRREDTSVAAKRKAMYDDLAMLPAQRVAMDSVLDARNCVYDSIFRPIRPTLDSLKAATRAKLSIILTPEQRVKLEARHKEHDARDEAERRRIRAACRR